MPTREVVAYYRVSTKAQGMYGLGMEAQRDAVAAYAKRNDCEIVATYGEVETGRREHMRNRPELVKAVAHARRCDAVLVTARIDRLARNVPVTSQLLESGVEFVAQDLRMLRIACGLFAALLVHLEDLTGVHRTSGTNVN
jgi:DNA invertase Pin-like site-specific DNA recombinase